MQEKQFRLRREALFSILVRRVIGPAFFLGGIIVGGYSVMRLVTTGNVLVENEPTADWFYIAVSVLLPGVVAILGLFLQRAEPHYIDE